MVTTSDPTNRFHLIEKYLLNTGTVELARFQPSPRWPRNGYRRGIHAENRCHGRLSLKWRARFGVMGRQGARVGRWVVTRSSHGPMRRCRSSQSSTRFVRSGVRRQIVWSRQETQILVGDNCDIGTPLERLELRKFFSSNGLRHALGRPCCQRKLRELCGPPVPFRVGPNPHNRYPLTPPSCRAGKLDRQPRIR